MVLRGRVGDVLVDLVRQDQQARVGGDHAGDRLQPLQGVHGPCAGRCGPKVRWACGCGACGRRTEAETQAGGEPRGQQLHACLATVRTRWVAGRAQDQQAAARRERGRQLLWAQQEVVLWRGVQHHGHAARQLHHLGV